MVATIFLTGFGGGDPAADVTLEFHLSPHPPPEEEEGGGWDFVAVRKTRHRRPESALPDHSVLGDVPNSLSARPDVGYLTLIGVGEEEKVSPGDLDHGVDLAVVEDVAAKLTARMPGMEHAVFRGGWSGLFTTTPDWHPILARVSEVEGLYCAVGFSGHGFNLAPMVGVVMAELVMQGEATTIDVSMLGLDRFAEGRLMQSRYKMSVLA